LIRDVFETFVRPVAGDLTIQSNHHMSIQAGIDTADFNRDSTAVGDAFWGRLKRNAQEEWASVITSRLSSSDAWTGANNGEITVKCKTYNGNPPADNAITNVIGDAPTKKYFKMKRPAAGADANVVYLWDDILDSAITNIWAFCSWPFRTLGNVIENFRQRNVVVAEDLVDDADEVVNPPKATSVEEEDSNASPESLETESPLTVHVDAPEGDE
ncbi:MAG: hypothetical protein J5612_02935, partial [Paludibacteraceae bacterium]|nr:hypothetical protein [Paludibacteraceae bacterium]